MSLDDQLRAAFHVIWRDRPNLVLSGHQLCERVRPLIDPNYATDSIKVRISYLAQDGRSAIERREGRHGYTYLGPAPPSGDRDAVALDAVIDACLAVSPHETDRRRSFLADRGFAVPANAVFEGVDRAISSALTGEPLPDSGVRPPRRVVMAVAVRLRAGRLRRGWREAGP